MKDKLISFSLLALLIGFGGGYLVGNASDDESRAAETTHSAHDDSHGSSHAHAKLDVPAEQAPRVSFIVTEDAKSGWNIEIETENFRFAPESVNMDHVLGEGHAHLYVDGKKVARLYGPNFHYDASFDGTKEFRVTLNTNKHDEYAAEGQTVEFVQEVTHDHDSDDSAHGSDDMSGAM